MKKVLFVIGILFIICSCEKIDTMNFKENDNPPEEVDETFVSSNYAAEIANLFVLNGTNPDILNAYSETRNEAINNKGKTIKSLESIYSEESHTAIMYVINYNEGGFVIVSATKNYYPILAYNEVGSISIENINNSVIEGLAIWSEETKSAIQNSKTFDEEILSKIKTLWGPYEIALISEELTRSSSAATYEKFRERLSQLSTLAPGYSFTTLSSAQSMLSAGDYNTLVQRGQSVGALDFSIFAYKQEPSQTVGPLLDTQWHQETPYNNLCPNQYPAGCVAIAMGQIMKFHRIPTKYNWNNMVTGTVDTQTLIYDIGVATKMKYAADGSGTKSEEAAKVFSAWGYNATYKDHDHNDVKNEILVNKRPVYMRGDNKSFLGIINWEGHAWVCEGARASNTSCQYFVEYCVGGNYTSLGGPSYLSPSYSAGYSSLFFYLNWGWGSNGGNGWFAFNDVNSKLGSFEHDRKNIYVNTK